MTWEAGVASRLAAPAELPEKSHLWRRMAWAASSGSLLHLFVAEDAEGHQ